MIERRGLREGLCLPTEVQVQTMAVLGMGDQIVTVVNIDSCVMLYFDFGVRMTMGYVETVI